MATAVAPAAMSFVPMCRTTSVAPATPATSSAKRASGGAPCAGRSANSSLREIPAFNTAIGAEPPAPARSVASASVQRPCVPGGLPTPSVIESPIATTASTGRDASTSRPLSRYDDESAGPNAAPPRLRVASPAARNDGCCARGCPATTGGATRTNVLIMSGTPARASTTTGSLVTCPPGGISIPSRPANRSAATSPGPSAPREPAVPAVAEVITSGPVPASFDSRTRTSRPEICGVATVRSVPPTRPGGTGSGWSALSQAVDHPGTHVARRCGGGGPVTPTGSADTTRIAAVAASAVVATTIGRQRNRIDTVSETSPTPRSGGRRPGGDATLRRRGRPARPRARRRRGGVDGDVSATGTADGVVAGRQGGRHP